MNHKVDKPVLVNFLCDPKLKDTFDELCDAYNMTRSAMLVELMTKAVLYKSIQVELWNEQMKQVDDVLKEHKRLLRQRYKASGKQRVYEEDIEEPVGIFISGMDDEPSEPTW